MVRIGIYGYECTEVTILNGYSIVPLYKNNLDVKRLSKDESCYHLTAFLVIDNADKLIIDSFIFDLEAVLSFVSQKDVLIRNKLRDNEDYFSLDDDFPIKLDGYRRANRERLIIGDYICKESTSNFIRLAMKSLSNENAEAKAFRKALFKVIEVYKTREHFIDVSYYLLFSALESLCRHIKDDFGKNCAVPITSVLQKYGFNVYQDFPSEPHQSIMTYVHLRNALFHNGMMEKEVRTPTGDTVVYRQSEYYSTFSRLLPLVLLRYIDFDDDYINWNSWLDRQRI
ncbi:hypothetical protein [Vibrio alfacsensis]|uniref:hypothetical protein n=1 Tax=Vibrio alfacsensis TaxID=1074311 RepID=UPI0040689EAD